MYTILISILSTLAIIYLVPSVLYGIASSFWGLKTPDNASPAVFLTSILISKIGVAIAFVLIFYFSYPYFDNNWLLYSFIWWIMFVFGEIGQAITPNYSWKEAVIGILSETIYLPLGALVISWMIVG